MEEIQGIGPLHDLTTPGVVDSMHVGIHWTSGPWSEPGEHGACNLGSADTHDLATNHHATGSSGTSKSSGIPKPSWDWVCLCMVVGSMVPEIVWPDSTGIHLV